MATTEDARRELFEAARDHLGQPAAEALMAVTNPANTDLATREDLELLRSELYRWFLPAVAVVVVIVSYVTR